MLQSLTPIPDAWIFPRPPGATGSERTLLVPAVSAEPSEWPPSP